MIYIYHKTNVSEQLPSDNEIIHVTYVSSTAHLFEHQFQHFINEVRVKLLFGEGADNPSSSSQLKLNLNASVIYILTFSETNFFFCVFKH